LYKVCPKCGHELQSDDGCPADQCPACGVIFQKWLQARFRREKPTSSASNTDSPSFATHLLSTLLYVEPEENTPMFWGRVVAWTVFVIWGWHFILMDIDGNAIGASFMHRVNLVFHEAGHVIFRLFGQFMTVLGGSLFQILMPLIVAGAFTFKYHNNFGASIALWWVGQSMMDIAPYINDARDRQLILLGGGTGEDRPWMHDWYNILGQLGMLHLDHRIAAIVDGVGTVLMLLAMAWGASLLWQQRG